MTESADAADPGDERPADQSSREAGGVSRETGASAGHDGVADATGNALAREGEDDSDRGSRRNDERDESSDDANASFEADDAMHGVSRETGAVAADDGIAETVGSDQARVGNGNGSDQAKSSPSEGDEASGDVSRETGAFADDRVVGAAGSDRARDGGNHGNRLGDGQGDGKAETKSPREPDEAVGAVSRETGTLADDGSGTVASGSDSVGGAVVSRETTALTEAATPSDHVSRETATSDSFDNSIFDTPIAREAARAVEVRNVRQQRWPRPPATRVLTVANQKGGVGKTTSAVNLAAALALHGLRVVLLDLDPQGNASTALGIEHGVGTPSIYDVLLGGDPIAEVLHPTEVSPTLFGVPATLDLAGADIELTSQVAREYRLQRAVTVYLDSFEGRDDRPDYLIIDCPPSLGLLTLNALVAGREVLIPIQCEYYALEGLAQLLKTVDLVRAHLNPTLTVTTVLLTMYDSRTRLADQVAAEVRQHFGPLVLKPVIPRNVRVSEAPGFGQTVMTYDAGSRGAVGYLEAAHEIAERGARGIGDGTDDPQAVSAGPGDSAQSDPAASGDRPAGVDG